jgi:hypothetical protein
MRFDFTCSRPWCRHPVAAVTLEGLQYMMLICEKLAHCPSVQCTHVDRQPNSLILAQHLIYGSAWGKHSPTPRTHYGHYNADIETCTGQHLLVSVETPTVRLLFISILSLFFHLALNMALPHHPPDDVKHSEKRLSIRLRNIGKDLLAMRIELHAFCTEFRSNLNSVKQVLETVDRRETQPDDQLILETEHLLRWKLSMEEGPHVLEDVKSDDGSRDNDLIAAQTPRPLVTMKHNKDFAEQSYATGGMECPLTTLGEGH